MQLRTTEKNQSRQRSSEITVLLEKVCRLEGRLEFEGTARIDGQFKGEIRTADVLVIGKDARVEGQIDAAVVVISGHFEGNILAHQRVEIYSPAVVKGVIEARVLHVEEGAVFEGESKRLRTPSEDTKTLH